MTYLKIIGWYGRLGNNIIQVSNAIFIALYYNYDIELPYHYLFNKQKLELIKNGDKRNGDKRKGDIRNGDKENKTEVIIDKNYFFFREKIENINQECFSQNINEMKKILRDLFKIKYESSTKSELNDLVIHIRSGDVFFKNFICYTYIMPPLSYYTNIISSNKFSNIYLVAQDNNNPCVNKLLSLYPNIKCKTNNFLEKDIKIIIGSKNIICSYGSFIPSLLLINEEIKNIYYPSYLDHNYLLDYLDKCLKIKVNLDKYKNLIKKWKNTEEQRKIMIEYK